MNATPPNVSLPQLRKASTLAQKVVKAIDVEPTKSRDHDQVGDEDVARIRVRDGFVTRNLISSAVNNAAIPIDHTPDVDGVQGAIEQALRSAERADRNGNNNGTVEASEWEAASRVAQNLGRFAAAHANDGLAIFDIKPYEKPGSKEWVDLAKREYFDPKDPNGERAPRFGTALITPRNELPSQLKGPYDQLRAQYPSGKIEASSLLVNESEVYFMHVMDDRTAHAQVVMPNGEVVARGTAKATNPEKPWADTWSMRWE